MLVRGCFSETKLRIPYTRKRVRGRKLCMFNLKLPISLCICVIRIIYHKNKGFGSRFNESVAKYKKQI